MPSIYIKVIAASSCFITALGLSGALSSSDTNQNLSILEETMIVHSSVTDESSAEYFLARALDFEEAGDEDVYRKVAADLGAKASEAEIRAKMSELMAEAKRQIMTEV